MSNQIVCHMVVKKETPGKVVYAELDQSPHFQESGVQLSVYIDKATAKRVLGATPASTATMLIEPGVVEAS